VDVIGRQTVEQPLIVRDEHNGVLGVPKLGNSASHRLERIDIEAGVDFVEQFKTLADFESWLATSAFACLDLGEPE